MNSNEPIYRVIFSQGNKTYELYVRYISEETMVGFIEVEQLIFSPHPSKLIDPSEEKLREEFKGVERIYIPMHSIFRIDELFKEGIATVKEHSMPGKSNVSHFPSRKQPNDEQND